MQLPKPYYCLLSSVTVRICRFGAYLVQQELAQAGDVLTVFFAILIGAFMIGQAGPNLQKLVQAQAAAGAIYEVINRVSPC